MKLLVCKNKNCDTFVVEELMKELMNHIEKVKFNHASCIGMCENGPLIVTFPDITFYQNVTKNRVKDILAHKATDLIVPKQHLFDPTMDVYFSDPLHRRTVKLFRWHLDKISDFDWKSIRDSILIFKEKYDIKGTDSMFPVRVALLGTTKGPELPKLIDYMGKTMVLERIDSYLRDNKYRI